MLQTIVHTRVMEAAPQFARSLSKGRVLFVDDDPTIRGACVEIAQSLGYEAAYTSDREDARSRVSRHAVDVLLVSVPAGDSSALDFIAEVHTLCPQVSIVAMSSLASLNTAVESMREGASDYLVKPFDVNDLSVLLGRAMEASARKLDIQRWQDGLRPASGPLAMVGHSAPMEKLYRILAKVAESTHPVLVLGESGTGKEMVARRIHASGSNADKPFLPIDCGSLVPTLIESELFGHVKGAFTGASHTKDGLLVAAETGTVFLDEIGELPLDLQAKLLRALQEKEVRPVGASHTVPIKARIVAATNRDLAAMVEHGEFRKDLFYRLNVVNLRLPPLRDRRDDIPPLAAHFLERSSRQYGHKFTLSDEVLRAMMHYDWPGNVRELENAIEHGCTFSTCGTVVVADLPTELKNSVLNPIREAAVRRQKEGADTGPVVTPIAELERRAILDAIRLLDGDKLKAARLLGIGKTTLYRKLKEYGIADPVHA
jgi:DNA-binding NtrC family response regulator